MLALLCLFGGCSTPEPQFELTSTSIREEPQKPESIILREGDILRITFPGAPNLNTTQLIRRDGRITLSMVGEVMAAGKSVPVLEKELKELYASLIVTKEVTVTLESSTFEVYVTGAVLRPGKVISSRPLTVLEAIMEAGGPDYTKANLKAVEVIRGNKGLSEHYSLNLKRVLNGEASESFRLKPSDIIYIREKFQWF